MKFVFALLAVSMAVSAVLAAEEMPYMPELMECATAFGFTRDEVMNMVRGKDERMGCIYSCLFTRFHADDGTKLNTTRLIEMIHDRSDKFPHVKEMLETMPACAFQSNDEHTHFESSSRGYAECAWEYMKEYLL